MAANDGNHPVRDLFGVPLPGGTGAPGQDPPGPRETDSIPAVITNATGDPWTRTAVASHGTIEPGQNNDGWAGNPTHDMTSTGAGAGSAAHYPRFSWQQPDGSPS